MPMYSSVDRYSYPGLHEQFLRHGIKNAFGIIGYLASASYDRQCKLFTTTYPNLSHLSILSHPSRFFGPVGRVSNRNQTCNIQPDQRRLTAISCRGKLKLLHMCPWRPRMMAVGMIEAMEGPKIVDMTSSSFTGCPSSGKSVYIKKSWCIFMKFINPHIILHAYVYDQLEKGHGSNAPGDSLT